MTAAPLTIIDTPVQLDGDLGQAWTWEADEIDSRSEEGRPFISVLICDLGCRGPGAARSAESPA